MPLRAGEPLATAADRQRKSAQAMTECRRAGLQTELDAVKSMCVPKGAWRIARSRLIKGADAGVVQWQNGSFPSCIRGFDSLRPLQSLPDVGNPLHIGQAVLTILVGEKAVNVE